MRELLDANRELCEHAIDPLEIAAALEDSGLATDGAARYRHADVFGLAEELYARVPRRPPTREPQPPADPPRTLPLAALRGAAAHLLPLLPAVAIGGLPGGTAAVLLGAGAALLTTRTDGGTPAELPTTPDTDGWGPAEPDSGSDSGAGPVSRPPRGGRPWAALGRGAGTGALLALLAAAAPGAAAAAALGGAGAGWAAAWLRRFGQRQGAAATLGEFRSRLRPALPLAVLAQLALLAALGCAVTDGLPATGWAALLLLGVLPLLADAVRDAGRPGAAAVALLAAATGATALALPAPAHWLGASPTGGLSAAALGPALLLAGCAWPPSTRPGAYR
ncbi:hypothetical protein KSE_48800 [Kitasatospora setae KM-6054]|uniref:Integral membrane protein n=1 Tax=Kitasatospora setae (strain ATCC 33774 / DSM 43861 / JCM 3304 / KCC A-0304 / NBRC 14216 / KM-6054) TaxID=452652 RepID=E4NGM8_KITSK|nr:hypothetical protein KSE_48800 [Kitasatospora setae KM-6054]